MDNEEIGLLILCYRDMGFLERERLHSMVSLARNMRRNLSTAVDMGHFTKMREIMVNIQDSSLNLKYAYLMNNDGMFLYYYMNGLRPETMRAKEGHRDTSAAARRSLRVSARKPLLIQDVTMPGGIEVVDITVPIIRKGNKIGVARIGYSLEDFRHAQNRARRNLVAMTMVFLFVGLVCAIYISFRISKPIRNLAATVQRVGRGGYQDGQIHISSIMREVRELEMSFNEMIRERRYAEQELRQREEQLRELARRVISAQEEERSRLSQELHDELGHRLMSMSLRLAAIRKKNLLPEKEIDSITDLLEETSGEIMRIFRGLSPSFIQRLGLSEALSTFAEIIQSQNTIQVSTDIETFGRDDLSRETAINLFRIAQEAFNNISKHSGATRAGIVLKEESGSLKMTIHDNGKGMDFDWKNLCGGLGMVGMRERAMALGGAIAVDSRPGGGTTITVAIPLRKHKHGEPEP